MTTIKLTARYARYLGNMVPVREQKESNMERSATIRPSAVAFSAPASRRSLFRQLAALGLVASGLTLAPSAAGKSRARTEANRKQRQGQIQAAEFPYGGRKGY